MGTASKEETGELLFETELEVGGGLDGAGHREWEWENGEGRERLQG